MHELLFSGDILEMDRSVISNLVQFNREKRDGCVLVVEHRELYCHAIKSLIENIVDDLAVLNALNLHMVEDILAYTDVSLIILGEYISSDGHALSMLVRSYPKVPVALMMSQANTDTLKRVFREGAAGLFLVSMLRYEFVQGVSELLSGRRFAPMTLLRDHFEMALADASPNPSRPAQSCGNASLTANCQHRMTPRELEIFTLLVQGASNKEIARQLDISVGTAKNYVATLLQRFGALSRAKLLPILWSHYPEILKAVSSGAR